MYCILEWQYVADYSDSDRSKPAIGRPDVACTSTPSKRGDGTAAGVDAVGPWGAHAPASSSDNVAWAYKGEQEKDETTRGRMPSLGGCRCAACDVPCPKGHVENVQIYERGGEEKRKVGKKKKKRKGDRELTRRGEQYHLPQYRGSVRSFSRCRK